MKIVKENNGEVKTVGFGKHRNWESKLGLVTPKVTPDEVIEAIFEGGPTMAANFLKGSGEIALLPGGMMTTIEHITGFYKVEPGYVRQLNSCKLKKFRGAGHPVSYTITTRDILADLRRRKVKANIQPGKHHVILSICGEGVECSHFTLPISGRVSLYTPEAVLAIAVCLFVSASERKSQMADNLVARLVSSEYVDIAMELREEKVRQAVENIRQEHPCECSEPVCPVIHEPSVEAPEASDEVKETPKNESDDIVERFTQALKDGNVESVKVNPSDVSVDLVKTLLALMGTLVTAAAVPFFKTIIGDSMETAMRKVVADMVQEK